MMAAPTYYTHKDPYPATLNHPNAVQLESTADWPKSYRYNSNHVSTQGIHPPGPVYNAQQQAPQPWYYYGGQVSLKWTPHSQDVADHHQQAQAQAQGGYYVNGQYLPASAGTTYSPSSYYHYQPSTSTYSYNWSRPSTSFPYFNWTQPSTAYSQINYLPKYYKNFQAFQALPQYSNYGLNPYSYLQYLVPGGPQAMPFPSCPGTLVSQAAAAAATNAALAAMPQAPSYFVGQTPAEVAMQQTYFAQTYPGMSMAQMAQWPKPPPTQLAPYKPADGQQFWCKEMDGSWTLRTHSDIINGEVNPGHWERHQTSGYFYWVRQG